ncbi:MAG: hypothetical protein V2I43_20705, partial [Parvularcula sp.]|nr:hypothetical protein [Parvularcula sp.]
IGSAAIRLLSGPGLKADERDRRVASTSQAVRGTLYLSVVLMLCAWAAMSGQHTLANLLFVLVLGFEIVSGLVMLLLYRCTA